MELKDTWLALKTIGELFITVFGFSLGFAFLYSLIFANNENILFGTIVYGVVYYPVVLLLFSKFIYNVWNAYNMGILVNLEDRTFSFPASDVENKVIDIITLKRFRDLAKRETLKLIEVEALTNEIKRWSTKSKDSNGKQTTKRHVKFLLNISGDFGSRQLEFNSKQKRDECRTMLNNARKKLNLKFDSSDINLDLQ